MTLYWDSTGGSQTALDELDRRDGDAGSSPALLNILFLVAATTSNRPATENAHKTGQQHEAWDGNPTLTR